MKKLKKNYIGGATFLEIYDAFRLNKKIYLYNDIPEGMLYDEIQGFAPIIINGDLSKIICFQPSKRHLQTNDSFPTNLPARKPQSYFQIHRQGQNFSNPFDLSKILAPLSTP